ncbi:MAG: hypothetical protein E4H27_08950 [Anaerolineales bacterium]|nr:MAG: hypothetical protein E4H27_08950 [Anaerolineales bacterium]
MQFNIPASHTAEPDDIPSFWLSSVDNVTDFLNSGLTLGRVNTIGKTAGGRPIQAVMYGTPRVHTGTTTFSGALGYRDVKAYIGPDYTKRVYMAMGAVHGADFEGIVGIVNLIAVLETGCDLRNKPWPELYEIGKKLERIILIPITNVDGRARVPIRMQVHHGATSDFQEYLNTGAKPDGQIIGWPACKAHIPLDFSTTQFPGGYPNDAGVNIQHDDFFGKRQPETEALFNLTALERPDLIVNMHTGAPGNNYYTRTHRSYIEPVLMPAFEQAYTRIHARLARDGYQSTADENLEANPATQKMSPFNLDSALNMHCGALTILIEAPCHGFSGSDRAGNLVVQTPDDILDAQLICHMENMRFLLETGGTWRWRA